MRSFRGHNDIEHNGVNGLRPTAGLQFSKRHSFVPHRPQSGWRFLIYLSIVAFFCLTLASWMRSLYVPPCVGSNFDGSNTGFHGNLNARFGNTKSPGTVMVEYGAPGNKILIEHALDLEHDKDETLGDAYRKLDGEYSSYKKPIHVLIAICSSCCQEISRIRRTAVRDTWIQDARSKEFENVIDVKFFLSQPESKAKLKQVSSFIKDEVASHEDIVVLPGKDTYINLREKTFNLMRYFALSSDVYTHLVKTDDDTWVRPGPLISSLYETRAVDPTQELSDAQVMTVLESIRKVERDKYINLHEKYSGAVATDTVKPHGAFKHIKEEYVFSKTAFHGAVSRLKNRVKVWLGIGLSTDVPVIDLPMLDKPRLRGVYMGSIENPDGFEVIRDSSSKWYMSPNDLGDNEYPSDVLYIAGWGYVLSRDNVHLIVDKVNRFEENIEMSPKWFQKIPWEDVLVGFLLANSSEAEHNDGFKAAWRLCKPDTIIKHLDVDSPRLLEGLVAQDRSGLAREKIIQCASLPQDYAEWYDYRRMISDAT